MKSCNVLLYCVCVCPRLAADPIHAQAGASRLRASASHRVGAAAHGQDGAVARALRPRRRPVARVTRRRGVCPRRACRPHARAARPRALRIEAAACAGRLRAREVVQRAQPRSLALAHHRRLGPCAMTADGVRGAGCTHHVVRVRAPLRFERPAQLRTAAAGGTRCCSGRRRGGGGVGVLRAVCQEVRVVPVVHQPDGRLEGRALAVKAHHRRRAARLAARSGDVAIAAVTAAAATLQHPPVARAGARRAARMGDSR